MKPIPIRLTDEVLERLDAIVKVSGIPRSELIRSAVTTFALEKSQ